MGARLQHTDLGAATLRKVNFESAACDNANFAGADAVQARRDWAEIESRLSRD